MGPPIRDKRTCTWHGGGRLSLPEHVAPVVEIEKREKGGGVDDGAVIARSAMLLQGLSGEREGEGWFDLVWRWIPTIILHLSREPYAIRQKNGRSSTSFVAFNRSFLFYFLFLLDNFKQRSKRNGTRFLRTIPLHGYRSLFVPLIFGAF